MICPHCDRDSVSRVLETRPMGDTSARRRECLTCKGTYVTVESVDPFTWPESTKTAAQRATCAAEKAANAQAVKDAAKAAKLAAERERLRLAGQWTNGALQSVWGR